MTEYTASNGIPVTLTPDGRLIVENTDHTYPATIAAGEHIQALREFFQHEATKKPWEDARRGDVWLFWNEVDSQRALAWRGPDDWDVIDPHGHFHSKVPDVVAEMEEHSLWGWEKPEAKLIYRIEDAS